MTVANEVYNQTAAISTTASCHQISANNVTIECNNFATTGDRGSSDSAVRMGWSLNGTTIQNCYLEKWGTAINFPYHHSNTTLLNDTVFNTSSTGLLFGLSGAVASKNFWFDNLRVNYTTTSGVFFDDFAGNITIKNSVFNNTGAGYYMLGFGGYWTTTKNFTLLNSTFNNFPYYAVYVGDANLDDVWWEGNTFTIPASSNGVISANGGNNGTFIRNTITGGTAYAGYWPVANSTVTQNNFSYTAGMAVSGSDGKWYNNTVLNATSAVGCMGSRCLTANETSLNSYGYYGPGQDGLFENITVSNGTGFGVYTYNVNETIRNLTVNFIGSGGYAGVHCDACSNLTVEDVVVQHDSSVPVFGFYASEVCEEAGYGYNPYYRIKNFWMNTSNSTGHAIFFGDDYGFGCATAIDSSSYFSNFTILGEWDGSSSWGNSAEVYFDGVSGLLFDNSTIYNPQSATTDLIRHDLAIGIGATGNNIVRNVNFTGGNVALRPTVCTTCVFEDNTFDNPNVCFDKETAAEFGVFSNNTCDVSARSGFPFITKGGLGATGGEISFNNFTLAPGLATAISWAFVGVGGSGYNISYNQFWYGAQGIAYTQAGSGLGTTGFSSPLIYNNSFFNQTGSAIVLGGASGLRRVTSANVSNNYFFGVGDACVQFNLMETGGVLAGNVCENSTTGTFFTAKNANVHNFTRDVVRNVVYAFRMDDLGVTTKGNVLEFTGEGNQNSFYCSGCVNWFVANGSFTGTTGLEFEADGVVSPSYNNTFLNQTGNYSAYSLAVAGDNFTVQWYVNASVKELLSQNPIENANLILTSALSTTQTLTTDANGVAYAPVNDTHYYNGGTLAYTPYSLTIGKANYQNQTDAQTVTTNLALTYFLAGALGGAGGNGSATATPTPTPSPSPFPVEQAAGFKLMDVLVALAVAGFLIFILDEDYDDKRRTQN